MLAVSFLKLRKDLSGFLSDAKKPALQNMGLNKGERAPDKVYELLSEQEKHSKILVLLTSTSCDLCKRIYPALNPLQLKSKNRLKIILFTVGDEESVKHVLDEYELDVTAFPSLWPDIKETFRIEHIPYAYVFSNEGKVLNKGLVNSQEQLSYLLDYKL
ncbi:hypothetical protein [Xylanibacillus composti]|uniref:hypothetical protein n=1 Tax=Xylanibacillus composti TaxID=1572762 RepID=UPI001BD177CD|nr:hypothetical protein [Xylanibacillus composti]